MRLKISWLHSALRTRLLTLRHFTLMNFFSSTPCAEVYLALNDPHSFVLIQILVKLEGQFKLNYRIYLILESAPGFITDPKLHRQWALEDANFLAQQYQLNAIKDLPSQQLLVTGQQQWQLVKKTLVNAERIFQQTWRDQFDEQFQISTPMISYQVKNQARLLARGHYSPASIFFAGEWFVGVDRLVHLEKKLTVLGLSNDLSASPLLSQSLFCSFLPVSPKNNLTKVNQNQCVEVFISLRSPYSYLGFVQALKLTRHYGMPLKIKPVLPLLMQGASVPRSKQKYIYLDALREAKKLAIPMKGFADPLGQGIINAYKFFAWAEVNGKAVDYISACFSAIYVDNIDLSKRRNIEAIYLQLNLDIDAALEHAIEHDWQIWANSNQEALSQLGFWGVPSFKYAQTACWGQDRLLQIEQAILAYNSIH